MLRTYKGYFRLCASAASRINVAIDRTNSRANKTLSVAREPVTARCKPQSGSRLKLKVTASVAHILTLFSAFLAISLYCVSTVVVLD